MNAEAQPQHFMLPAGVWEVILDTTHALGMGAWHGQGEVLLPLPAGSLLLLAAAGAGVKL